MKKLFAFCLLLFAVPAFAQFTTVTGTVIDPNGIPYSNGTLVPTLVSSASPTLNGFAYTPPAGPIGLDAGGSFIVNLASQASLSPGATTWNFQVCSATGTVQPAGGTGPQCFTVTGIVVAGASQSISAQLQAAALALTRSSSAPCPTCVTSPGLTLNRVPKASAARALSDSSLSDDGTTVSTAEGFTLSAGAFLHGATSPTVNLGTNSVTSEWGTSSTPHAVEYAPTANSGNFDATRVDIDPNPSGNSSTHYTAGSWFINTPATMAFNFTNALVAGTFGTQPTGTGTIANLFGVDIDSANTNGAPVTNNWGIRSRARLFFGNNGTTLQAAFICAGPNGSGGCSGFGSNPSVLTTINTDAGLYISAPGLQANGILTHHYAVGIIGAHTGGTGNADGWGVFEDTGTTKNQFGLIGTVGNCSSSGGTCSTFPAGSVSIAAAATTVTVATTAVTANSQIFIQEDSSLGTKLGVTCNTTIVRTYAVTARTAGTSFVITASAAPAVNPACLSYSILN